MTSVRLPWDAIPDGVRGAVEEALGAPVVEAVNQTGGYGPSLAARCRLGDGRRAFIKPDPPGLPFVRGFQAAQGAVTRRWLRQRTGWER